MNRLLRTLLIVIWGLWFGGLVMLFCAVQTLFNTFAQRREIAGEGASSIFHFFSYYHLSLAAAALILSFLWRLAGAGRFKILLFGFFALATVAGVYVSAFLTPELEHLRAQAATHGARFRQLHGLSMGIYLVETIFVFLAGLLLPGIGSSKTDQPTLSDRAHSP